MRHVAETTGCNLEQLYTEASGWGWLAGLGWAGLGFAGASIKWGRAWCAVRLWVELAGQRRGSAGSTGAWGCKANGAAAFGYSFARCMRPRSPPASLAQVAWPLYRMYGHAYNAFATMVSRAAPWRAAAWDLRLGAAVVAPACARLPPSPLPCRGPLTCPSSHPAPSPCVPPGERRRG